MKTLLLAAFAAATLHAQTPAPAAAPADLSALLRDALFEEEATRDLTKAASAYEALLEKWSAQRPLAAAALYRLAEVRRKQDRQDDAIKLYQRLVTEFADIDPHARLSRENLTALGAKNPPPNTPPATAPAATGDEAAALIRAQKLAAESPDLLVDGEFTQACEKGWLSVVKFLLSKNITDHGDGLREAARYGHLAVIRELLSQKSATPEATAEHWRQPEQKRALSAALNKAVSNRRTAVVRLLLEFGASSDDPDEQAPAITEAIIKGHKEILDLLLAHKASVNPPKAQTTPLFAAAWKADHALVQRLLDLGADVHKGGNAPFSRPFGDPNRPLPAGARHANPDSPVADATGSTPLHAAVWAGSAECVALLLKAKADPNAANESGWTPLHGAAKEGNTALVEQLLAAGAKPQVMGGTENKKRTPLTLAIEANSVPSVKALLKAGASPNLAPSRTVPLTFALYSKSRDELLPLLLDAGADPTAEDDQAIERAEPAQKIALIRGYRYPQLVKEPRVTFIFADTNIAVPLAERRAPDEAPGTLPALFLAWHDKGGWKGNISPVPDWSVLRLYRNGADGKMTTTLLPIVSGMKFPPLQWGDVIEILYQSWNDAPPEQDRGQPGPRGSGQPVVSSNTGLPNETIAILRAGQSARITFKSGDLSKTLTLRGLLRTYDPATGEAPLQSLADTVTLLAGDRPGMVKIERTAARGGGTVEWAAGSENGSAFPEDGDVITFTPDKPNAENLRVALRVTGQPGVWQSYGPPESITLLQFLSEFYRALPPEHLLHDADPNRPNRTAILKALTPEDIVANITSIGRPLSAWPYLPWPDWSGVKVRRVKVSHRKVVLPTQLPERVITSTEVSWGEPEPFDLLAAMKLLTAESTPEDARMFDTILNPGDEVELPLLKDHPPGPWPGFDEAALRLFTKALTAKITVVDPDANFREHTLQWLPPRWVPTPAGVFPVPDGDATGGRVHWLRAREFTDSVAPGMRVQRIERDGKTILDNGPNAHGENFLRHGDTLYLSNPQAAGGVRIPAGSSLPPRRVRTLPPTPSPQ